MKHYNMIIIFIIMLTGNSYAYEFGKEWTYKNTILEGVFFSTMVVDMFQTIHIEEHPEEFEELNPVIDNHERNELIRYFAVMAASHALISVALYPGYRETFQFMGIGVETVCIINNKMVGVKLEVKF